MYLSSKDVKEIDKYCIEKLGIPEIVLMENAALKVVKNINDKRKKVVIICGTGNNGGDGLAVGRHLLCSDKQVVFFIVGSKDKMSKACDTHYKILNNLNANIIFVERNEDLIKLENVLQSCDLIIDSIFGIGLSREVKGIYRKVIEIINNASKYVLAIDVPSGLDANTGELFGCSVKANKTVTFIGEKHGFSSSKAKQYLGEVIVEQISVPKFVVEKTKKVVI